MLVMNRNTHGNTTRLLGLMVATAFTICHADDKAQPTPEKPPAEAELRSTITKGLGFLAKAEVIESYTLPTKQQSRIDIKTIL